MENLFNCWKPLKLKLPKCENVLDVTMGNQQGSLIFMHKEEKPSTTREKSRRVQAIGTRNGRLPYNRKKI